MEHIVHIQEVFDRIREVNLRLKAEKCHFAISELQFLGHVVGKDLTQLSNTQEYWRIKRYARIIYILPVIYHRLC